MAPPRKSDTELLGLKFGRMTVIAFAERAKRKRWWLCRCDCGTQKKACHTDLLNGATKSCGCLGDVRLQQMWDATKVHGHSGKRQTPTYRSWHKMKQRCLNPNDDGYQEYGGRGITICERWLSFENFLADMGERPKGTSIDRKDTNGNYEPFNCRWATPKEQCNNMRKNVFLEYAGRRLTVAQWSREVDVSRGTIRSRLASGWSVERALCTPSQRPAL